MKVLVIEPERLPEVREISGTLQSLQGIVGGTIEAICPFEDDVALVCNDEGKLLNLPMNRTVEEIDDVICGTFLVVGLDPDEEDFSSLTDEQLERYAERFHFPELFLSFGDDFFMVICS